MLKVERSLENPAVVFPSVWISTSWGTPPTHKRPTAVLTFLDQICLRAFLTLTNSGSSTSDFVFLLRPHIQRLKTNKTIFLFPDECSWCNKSITSDSGALQQAGATFCSELCFSQSRRANFKRAKTCDWCRHVRHTVAYVDFQVILGPLWRVFGK